MAANRKVIVVEAASQIGGRCQTDITTFEVPFDRGARWMHNPETNPMIKPARAAGLEITTAPLGEKICICSPLRPSRRDRRVSRSTGARQPRHRRRLAPVRRFLRLGAAERYRRLGRYGGIRARCQFRRQGFEGSSRSSTRPRAQDRNSAIACRQGLGTLIAKLGEQLPLSLSWPANRISWVNPDVTLQPPWQQCRRRRVCRHGVEQCAGGGNIKFSPDISKRALDAASKLSLGSYDRIALQMPGNPLGLARDDVIIEQSNSTRTALMYANMGGSSLCTLDVAGSFCS